MQELARRFEMHSVRRPRASSRAGRPVLLAGGTERRPITAPARRLGEQVVRWPPTRRYSNIEPRPMRRGWGQPDRYRYYPRLGRYAQSNPIGGQADAKAAAELGLSVHTL